MKKFARTGLAVIAIVGLTVGGSVVPAQAQSNIPPNTAWYYVYYNNAQHTTVVGGATLRAPSASCWEAAWGTATSYYTVVTAPCNS
jgi:hypothetical protein